MENCITTCEVPAILGIDPHKTAVDVFDEHAGLAKPETTEAMKIGAALKEVAKKVWEEETGVKIEEAEMVSSGHSCGKPDGMVDGCPLIVASSPVAWDEIPETIVVKAQHYMGMGGWEKTRVICMVSGFGKCISEYEIERNEEVGKSILEKDENFWTENAEKDMAPDPKNIEDCRKIWPVSMGETIDANEEIASKVESLKVANAKVKEAEAEADGLKKEIMEFMGNAEILMVNGKKAISWKNNKDSSKVDYKGLVEALAPSSDLLAEHTSTVPGARVFRVSK